MLEFKKGNYLDPSHGTTIFDPELQATEQENQIKRATRLVNKFILVNSPFQVNIPHKMREKIVERFKSGVINSRLFDEGLNEVKDMLRKDAFERYKKSNVFKAYQNVATRKFAQRNYKIHGTETTDALLGVGSPGKD